MTLERAHLDREQWERILAVISSPMGDLLKAMLLAQITPLRFDFHKLPLPPGLSSSTFARAAISKQIPPEVPVTSTLQSERISSVPVPVRLRVMPPHIRFDEPIVDKNAPQETAKPMTDEVEIDGEVWITAESACAIRNCSHGSLMQAAWLKDWKRMKDPSDGRKSLYLKEQISIKRGKPVV